LVWIAKLLASPGKNASILSALRRTRRCRRKCLHSRLCHLCPTQKCAEHIWWCLLKEQIHIYLLKLFVYSTLSFYEFKNLLKSPLPFSSLSLIFTVFLYLTGSPPNQN